MGLPYTSLVKTMRIEAQGNQGTAQGKRKHISHIVLRLYESLGGDAGTPDEQDPITFDDFTAGKIDFFTGDKIIRMPSKWDTGRLYSHTTDRSPANEYFSGYTKHSD